MSDTTKARHIDFYPDEFIAGTSGMLTPEQAGVYWVICSLIYSRSSAIENDAKWLGNIMGGTHWRTMRRIIDELLSMGKVVLKDGQLWVKRCGKELAKTEQRISKASANGRQGGRPSSKNNHLKKPGGFFDEKLTTNHQPPTTNHIKDTDVSFSQERENRFDEFWSIYPRRTAKKNAERAYAKAVKGGASHEEIIRGCERYAIHCQRSGTEQQFIAHAATWINGERWNDRIDAAAQGNNSRGHNQGAKKSFGQICAELSERLGGDDAADACEGYSQGVIEI